MANTQKNNITEPQSIEAEQAVLAACVNFRDAIFEVTDIIHADHFYDPRHRLIFEAMGALAVEGEPIDLITLANQLECDGKLAKAGGRSYLAELTGHIASTANVRYHAEIVREKYIVRNLIALSRQIVEDARSGDKSARELLEESSEAIYKLVPRLTTNEPQLLGEILPEVVEAIKRYKVAKGGITGISTGFTDLDNLTGGLHPELTVIAGRPSMGKSAIAWDICSNLAAQGQASLYITPEMSKLQVGLRSVSKEAEVNSHFIRTGRIDEFDRAKINQAMPVLKDHQILIDDTSGISPIEILAKARRMLLRHKIRLLVIDYLNLIDLVRAETKAERIGATVRMIKDIQRSLDISVILISQINRKCEERTGLNKRPTLADLKESGTIEEHADDVIFVFRPEYYKIWTFQDGKSTKNLAEIILAKQRNGPTGAIRLIFRKEFMRFLNYFDDSNMPPEPARSEPKPAEEKPKPAQTKMEY